MSIQRYLEDLNRVKAEWRAHWVLPFGSAYTNAYHRFQNTLADQRKADELKAKLAVMALTMAIGGGFGALFGKSAVSSVALDSALTVICNRNMTRTFDALHYVANNPAATFLAGQAWSNASSLLSDWTKQKITGLVGTTTAASDMATTRPRDLIERPQVAQNKIERYLELVYAAAHRIGEDIRDNGVMRGSARDDLADQLRQAPFFNSPTRDVIPPVANGTPNAEEDLELAMYMVLVMDADVVARYRSDANSVTATYSRREERITVGVDSPDYPTATSRREVHRNFLGFVSGHTVYRTEIEYHQLGSTITSRIDTLHNRRFGSNFFRSRLDGDEVRRAERVAGQINQLYSAQLQPAPSAPPELIRAQ